MTQKLHFNDSFQIVQSALETVRPGKALTLKDPLRAHISTTNDLEHFCTTLVDSVSRHDFTIATEKIPTDPEATLEQIAQALAAHAIVSHNIKVTFPDGKSIPPKRRTDIAFELPGHSSTPPSTIPPPKGPSKDDDDQPPSEEKGTSRSTGTKPYKKTF